ncbi:PREDICTED: peroxisomal membrane protein 11C isoform X2 [Nicrophorus vespilloides]|uniref:Peroxisomal membrane protein 11C isoform X2 n=1 Tax=Nicrophorus vespilloides TaxID=110193 RepID=A0ABM1NAE4_NICVS|nr:PREDICTED: peroxisomal membrane protein 11C isoform X2 [Nicrophorus vespilloides]
MRFVQCWRRTRAGTSTKLIGGLAGNEVVAKRLLAFSSKMSGTRAVLRLLDDLPMLKYNLEYGLGGEEPDKLMASLGVVTNVIDQIYYPIEKMSWLLEHKLIDGNNGGAWDTASSVFWVASIYFSLMRNLRYVAVLEKHKNCIGSVADKRETLEKLLLNQKFEFLTCIRLSLDLVHAINTLPKGYLWGEKLNNWQVGLIASASSFLGLYQLFAKRQMKQ